MYSLIIQGPLLHEHCNDYKFKLIYLYLGDVLTWKDDKYGFAKTKLVKIVLIE